MFIFNFQRQQAEADARDVLLELLRRLDDEVQSDDNDKVVQRIAEDEAEVANEAEETDLESEARDTLGVYRGPTRGQQLIWDNFTHLHKNAVLSGWACLVAVPAT